MNKFTEELQVAYGGKKVLITGIHGFKGAWLAQLMLELGADVYGYGLPWMREDVKGNDALYKILELDVKTTTIEGDVSDAKEFHSFFDFVQPDFIFHMAAQPLVSLGYDDPIMTYQSNVMGTAVVLNAARMAKKKLSIVNITTDKVYKNLEKAEGYSENDELNGHDPYSNSKSCADLVAQSFNNSYFRATWDSQAPVILSSVRAGNVIGGGDFAKDRIIPDLARTMNYGGELSIRNPKSIRPYQHVLDCVFAYAIIGARQSNSTSYVGEYNIGPNKDTVLETSSLVEYFVEASRNIEQTIKVGYSSGGFKETNILLLNSELMRDTFAWKPVWGSSEELLERTFSWYSEWAKGANSGDLRYLTINQIRDFLNVKQD